MYCIGRVQRPSTEARFGKRIWLYQLYLFSLPSDCKITSPCVRRLAVISPKLATSALLVTAWNAFISYVSYIPYSSFLCAWQTFSGMPTVYSRLAPRAILRWCNRLSLDALADHHVFFQHSFVTFLLFVVLTCYTHCWSSQYVRRGAESDLL